MNKKTMSLAVVIIILAIFVGGFFYFLKSKKEIAPVEVEEQATSAFIDQKEKTEKVSSWKVYRNEKFNFEIKYPEDWTIDDNRSDENKLVFNPGLKDKPGSIEAINFKENKDNLNLEEIIEKQKNNYKQVIRKEEFLFIDNERAWKIETSEFNISRIFFIHGNFMYEIESMGYLKNKDVLDRFIFLDKNPAL